MPWYLLSGFADEISTDIVYQMDCLDNNDIKMLDLRSAFAKNVMEFEDWQNEKLKREYHNRKFRIATISSPIGKTQITEPYEETEKKLAHAIKLAQFYQTPFIRIFSFYYPEGTKAHDHRDEVMKRLTAMAQMAAAGKVTLLLENESKLYGDRAEDVLDILKTVNSPALKQCFDFGNFVNAGHASIKTECWDILKPYVRYIHIKDVSRADQKPVPAGQGDGEIEPILRDVKASGMKLILALEPHLASAGQFQGFSGDKMFTAATQALKGILAKIGE
ncbi:MAG: sugar phosphate isomerase/epimerase family protein [Planctomycetota bacterium]